MEIFHQAAFLHVAQVAAIHLQAFDRLIRECYDIHNTFKASKNLAAATTAMKRRCVNMYFDRETIRNRLHAQLKSNGHIIGVAAGAGISAKYAVKGGADFILALNSGRFRQMGLSSLGGCSHLGTAMSSSWNSARRKLYRSSERCR